MVHLLSNKSPPSIIRAVTEELFRDFDNTLRSSYNEKEDRKSVFRTLRYARIRLHVLCGYISKEDTQDSRTQIQFLYVVIGYIDTELDILNRYGNICSSKHSVSNRRWTGSVVEVVE